MTHAQNLARSAELEAQIAALQAELDSITAITPISIYVNWSESADLRDGTHYPFADFEAKARTIAWRNGCDKGYLKTNVTVTLSNGDTITVRCDLAEDDDHGFASVVRSYQNHLAKNPHELSDTSAPGHGFLNLINSITV